MMSLRNPRESLVGVVRLDRAPLSSAYSLISSGLANWNCTLALRICICTNCAKSWRASGLPGGGASTAVSLEAGSSVNSELCTPARDSSRTHTVTPCCTKLMRSSPHTSSALKPSLLSFIWKVPTTTLFRPGVTLPGANRSVEPLGTDKSCPTTVPLCVSMYCKLTESLSLPETDATARYSVPLGPSWPALTAEAPSKTASFCTPCLAEALSSSTQCAPSPLAASAKPCALATRWSSAGVLADTSGATAARAWQTKLWAPLEPKPEKQMLWASAVSTARPWAPIADTPDRGCGADKVAGDSAAPSDAANLITCDPPGTQAKPTTEPGVGPSWSLVSAPAGMPDASTEALLFSVPSETANTRIWFPAMTATAAGLPASSVMEGWYAGMPPPAAADPSVLETCRGSSHSIPPRWWSQARSIPMDKVRKARLDSSRVASSPS
mmetsp:Transcript_18228/g.51067  ORF Transcript_18228/g.51067 Transcript_18228/m.51067 type:complete len:439 (-) Transcript_18228:274-1590(-)